MDKARSGPVLMERRYIPCDIQQIELREFEPGEPKRLSWYPALFESLSDDLGGFRERIGRRAFSRTIEQDDIRALVNHDPNMVLGRTSKKTLKVGVDMTGLHANVKLPDTSYARDLLVNIENGNITGGSFMFSTIRDTWIVEELDGGEEALIRTLNEVRLYDVSPVTFPAYPATEGTAAVRSWLPNIKACLHCAAPCEEQSLRSARCQGAAQPPVKLYRVSLLRRRLELAKRR